MLHALVQKWFQNPISALNEAGFRIYLGDDLRGSKGFNGCVADLFMWLSSRLRRDCAFSIGLRLLSTSIFRIRGEIPLLSGALEPDLKF
jgi:hypothetical protein